jgi:glucan phosphoethanolaminetransferase (alkaline phosphatase superfamily)
MLTFFDYLYYAVCDFYSKRGEKEPRFTALLISALMHSFNLLSILFFISLITQSKIGINKFYAVIMTLALIILNGIRYNKYNYDVMKEKWGNEEESKKKKKAFIIVLYVILSTVLFFWLAIYLGSKRF